MPLIETNNLRKNFKTRQGLVEAVRGVDMRVEAGEIFGFLGPNGAGKTTTQRILTTLLLPDAGQATIAGYDVQREPERVREQIGYVSQSGGIDGNATGNENLLLQARLYNIAQPQERATELFAALELTSHAQRLARTYSGGQKRRLDLAMGIIHKPAVLFLDEPTTGLDPQSRAWLWNEIRNLRSTGTTIFLTTHYLEEVDALCDRLAIIDDGKIIIEGTPDELKRSVGYDVVTLTFSSSQHALQHAYDLLSTQTFVHEARWEKDALRLYVEHGDQQIPIIIQTLSHANIPLQAISLTHPSLDDVFLRLTGRSLRDSDNETSQTTHHEQSAEQVTSHP